jgi:hypothetical protein
MQELVLFLAAIALASYLIPVLAFLVRGSKPAEQPVRRRPVRTAHARARAGNEALDRLVELVADDPPAHRPELPSRSDKVVNLR